MQLSNTAFQPRVRVWPSLTGPRSNGLANERSDRSWIKATLRCITNSSFVEPFAIARWDAETASHVGGVYQRRNLLIRETDRGPSMFTGLWLQLWIEFTG